MALPKPLALIFQYMEQNQETFLERLRNAIAIPSVPTSEEKKQEIISMINWTKNLLESFGITTVLRDIQDERYLESSPLPPVLLGDYETGTCPNKATILVYGNLDVKDATREDGWKTEPFQLFQEDDYLIGRGVLDKSTITAWLNTIESYHSLGVDCPVHIKFVLESMGTESNEGLKNLLLSEKDKFLAHIDYVCLTKGSWLEDDVPCIIQSLKGLCCFSVHVECATKNLNCNTCAGIIQEAMYDLIRLLASLTDENGNLNIPLEVETLADEEIDIYANAQTNLTTLMENVGAKCLSHSGDKLDILKHRMAYPNLTIHGIESTCTKTNESEIPSKAIAILSIRTVHNQTPEKVFECVKRYLDQVWSGYGSSNKMTVSLDKSLEAWQADINHMHHQVGSKAFNHVYGRNPLFLKNGYVIPVVNMLAEVMEKNILLLPMGPEENLDVNEKFKLANYNAASKVFAAYLYEMGELPTIRSKSSTSFVSCKSVAEMCVCGTFVEKIQAASGDAEKCVCTDQDPKVKQLECPKFEPAPPSEADVDVDTECCLCPAQRPAGEKKEKTIRVIREEDTHINKIELTPPLIPTNCKCLLVSSEIAPTPQIGEIISLMSNASAESRDPTPISETKPKKDVTPSVDTLKCECIPKQYKNKRSLEDQESLPEEKREELMKSTISVGSVRSGESACETTFAKTPRMNILGCVCPEKSTETVCEVSAQVERMLCPLQQGEICTEGGKRRRHLTGPPPIDEEESATSIGPLSHCPSEESMAVIPECECGKFSPPFVVYETTKKVQENLENEVD